MFYNTEISTSTKPNTMTHRQIIESDLSTNEKVHLMHLKEEEVKKEEQKFWFVLVILILIVAYGSHLL